MRIQTLQYLITTLTFALASTQLQAQVSNYNPFFIVDSYENTYRTDQGLLTLPYVSVLPTVNNPLEQLFNVVLQHRGGNDFELISVDELLPEQECTRAEVREAIPLLRLNMTVTEAESLIGCTANIQPGSVDLDTGREVFASWVGNDGVPNSRNGSAGSSYIRGNSSVWIGSSSNSVFRAPLFSGSSPAITFTLRENVLQSISHSDIDQFRFCYNADLLAGFRQIDFGLDYAAVVASLECEGNLQWVSFDDNNTQQEYSWQVPPAPQTGQPTILPGVVARPYYEAVRITVLNDSVQSLRYDSSTQVVSATNCTIEDLETAVNQIQSGQSDSELNGLLDCGVRSESFSSNGITETVNYRWQTSIPNESSFISSNRLLQVAVVDGIVRTVRLQRF